ncbi:MAG: hypothetical protein ACOC2B_04850, partial [Sediminispirochaetaceae bacterium]
FIDCYPFLPYQLDILPEIFKSLGKGSDDQLAGSERTLIDVTQSVLKDEEYLYNEVRYKALKASNPERAEKLLGKIKENIDRKYKEYKYLADRPF